MKEFSICIPAYNYGHYLGFTVDSCLKCDADFELIILDNYSSDSTPLLKDKYIHDKRVKWFRNDELLPVQKNWNKAVALTSGKYVKLLQADDILLPGFFEIFEDTKKRNPSIVGHLATMIDKDGTEIRKQAAFGIKEMYTVTGEQALQLKLRSISRFKEPSCNFFQKAMWEKIGGYNESIRFVFDVHFNSLVAFHFGGVLINKYGAGVRRHSGSDGATLPSQLAVSELDDLVNLFYEMLSDKLTKKDKMYGTALVQYRIIELFLQKVSRNPFESLKFLIANARYLKNIPSFFITLQTIKRKTLTGDVQRAFEKSDL